MVVVADILNIESLALVPLTVPHPNAPVRWVATSELRDPSPFLEGGEVLLTTGLLDRDTEGWHEFATQAVDAGVVALGFAVGLSHPEVPSALTEAAADVELNLFVVPRPTPFIAVSRSIADLLTVAERDADRQALAHQQTLTSAAVSATGTTAVLEALTGIISGDVILVGPRGTVIAHASLRPPADLASEALPLINRINASTPRGSATEITASARLTVQPVGSGTRVDAFLVVETAAAFSPPQRSAMTTAIALLALDRERARTGQDADRRLRAGVLSLLLSGDLGSATSLLAATSSGQGLLGETVVVTRATGPLDAMERALSRIEELGPELDFPLAAIVANSGSDQSPQLVVAILHDEKHVVTLREVLTGLQAGIGRASPLNKVAHSDETARKALEFTSPSRPVVTWAELSERGIDAIIDVDALQLYAETLLSGVLAVPDHELLLGCVRSFLKHNGKIGPTARELGVHRNTVLNRLSAVEGALGRSLHDPQVRSDLWIALKNFDPGD